MPEMMMPRGMAELIFQYGEAIVCKPVIMPSASEPIVEELVILVACELCGYTPVTLLDDIPHMICECGKYGCINEWASGHIMDHVRMAIKSAEIAKGN